ncbi:GerMN domain-containing protein [Micromonospora avicenniae]|uniref:Sporulation and spore germination n=1 Tax=Micromonospora avicenniae TaxID=1198245 RepID=A0A1N6VIN0_9ACTN|nr:GerMN domain-containing protein [Micromonospora avicenniae]SIQ77732.1 Sporulation and spore germination [Micromonospora avicenniae]
MSRRLLAGALLVGLLGGCGVPVDEEPRRVQPPPGSFPTTGTAGPTAASGRVTETLCFVREDRLDRAVRRVDALPGVDVHLQHLLAGPAAGEREAGFASALPGTVTVAGVRMNGTLAEVDVRAAGEETGRSDEVLAFGQIVCTLTTRSDVRRVSFRRDGRPLDVPRGDGSLSRDPLGAADYAPLMPVR